MSELSDQPVFEQIKSRRVHNSFQEKAVSRDVIEHLIAAARWAPSAGNRRMQKFVVICDLTIIELVRKLSPGMMGSPRALILICNDLRKARKMGIKGELDKTNWIDIGSAAQNIMLAAQELGLASSPATSFSRKGVRTILDLPEFLEPEYFVQLGYPAPESPRKFRKGVSTKLSIADLTYWHSPCSEEAG